eukprot:661033-Prorocentrum_minimum.AAC.3
MFRSKLSSTRLIGSAGTHHEPSGKRRYSSLVAEGLMHTTMMAGALKQLKRMGGASGIETMQTAAAVISTFNLPIHFSDTYLPTGEDVQTIRNTLRNTICGLRV